MQGMTWMDIAEAASKHPLVACSPEEEAVIFGCADYEGLDGRKAPKNAVLDCYIHCPPESRKLLTPRTGSVVKGSPRGCMLCR